MRFEEQFDTHQLSHDARQDVTVLLYLALTMLAEGKGKVIWCVFPALQAFSDAQTPQKTVTFLSLTVTVRGLLFPPTDWLIDWLISILISGANKGDRYRTKVGADRKTSISVHVLDEGWSSVYSMSLSFVIHKNRKIKALEGVWSAWRHTDGCVTSCSKASCFLMTIHQGIQATLKHRQS